MGEMILIAGIAAVGFIIIMMKLGIGRFIRFGGLTDIVVSIILGVIFFGTFSGMAVGILAGIFISIFLWIAKVFVRIKNIQ